MSKKSLSSLVGSALRDLRKQQGFSMGRLSEASGVSKSIISTLEAGKRDVHLSTLDNLCRPLNVYVWELIQIAEP